jgi:hypothetical protein
MRNYISDKQELRKGNFLTIAAINIIIKDELMFDLSLADLESVLAKFPKSFLKDLDYIMFGDFDFLRKKGYNASYKDGVIYVLNSQENNLDIIDDIVHEIGHSVEEMHRGFVYGDGQLQREFLSKRRLLGRELEKQGYDVPDHMYTEEEYDEGLDNMFANEIGYPAMTSMAQGIFYSPYAATSLREYFANGFEAYFYHRDLYLKKVSPLLFMKIEQLEIGEAT